LRPQRVARLMPLNNGFIRQNPSPDPISG